MAKCDLTVELDHPDAFHEGGGLITGRVLVLVDGDVTCNGLEVQSVWRTHGRGNVATGTAGSSTLFHGQWRAGEQLEYRFELPVADWPPTYHGHYLNVDHYVDARAKIPWGFDPKASAPFKMRPTCGADGAKVVKEVTEVRGLVGFIVGVIVLSFIIAFVIGIAVAGPFSLIFLLFPLIGGVYWFFRKFLPRWLLGEVECRLEQETLTPGESATGELVIEPNKGVAINGVTLLFQAREQCVSGSGSNRTTHQHVFFEQTEVLQEATRLSAGVRHRFPIAITLPGDAPFSLDLDDNDLIWSATVRVDIPRWPDWVKEVPVTVVPSGQPSIDSVRAGETVVASSPRQVERVSVAASDTAAAAGASRSGQEGITFAETVSHLWSLREDRDQVEMLVEAVTGLRFELEVIVERRLLYSGDEDPHGYEDGYAVWAHYPDPPLPMVLYVPGSLADDFEQVGRDRWRGVGTIVGWDRRHGRLQVKLETE